ncbi:MULTISPECIES: DoxX family protein [unclassified Streptomyces]|uniref:DoxX family protein n=1 Tax=unclassified Streptomyces TaxID=2593676 RepID=UPI001BED0B61|nr:MULTISPECIES: DoxX family protein [unclassified Streptomyces]MBT2407994.1 DoxX family protein [Streptomyces sp. ISL-21]MBT2613348.1 DoxX family protein [Streptomyces sp. ISL-87]
MTSPSVATTKPQATAPVQAALSLSTPGHDTGLLLLRLVLGVTMAAHGSQKLFGWFGGGGIEGTGQFFTASGYPAGDAMAVVAGLTETLGGLGLVLGLLTPLAGAAVVGTMINAIAVHGAGSFFAPKGIEYELLLTVGAAALALTGPGAYAADRFLPVLRGHRLAHGALALALGVALAVVTLLVRK